MAQSPVAINSFLFTVVLATLAIGLPILVVLSIRFLWNRNSSLGGSKELEKLIWQLQRIAGAMEHQMNLSFSAAQPGTEEPHDLASLQKPPSQLVVAAQGEALPSQAAPATQAPEAELHPVAPVPDAHQDAPPALAPSDPSVRHPRRGGVNSMFGI